MSQQERGEVVLARLVKEVETLKLAHEKTEEERFKAEGKF